MYDQLRQALRYVSNTGETATVAQFDDDHEPIGLMLRLDMVPRYVSIEGGVLHLTAEGRAAVAQGP